MTGKQEMQDTVARALCRDNFNEPCAFCRAEARLAVAALVLGGYIRLDIGDLVEASSLGTPGANAPHCAPCHYQQQGDDGECPDHHGDCPTCRNRCQCYEHPGDNSSCPVHPYVPTPLERFEVLLAHPNEQFDRRSEILASIEAYAKAAPATAGYVPPTGGGAGDTPPATSADPDPTAQADQAIGSPTPPPPDIRRFYLYRHVDHSCVSGTGIVAWGAQWPDKTASLRWAGLHPSTVAWANVERIVAVHGHQGSTELRWLDGGISTGQEVSA